MTGSIILTSNDLTPDGRFDPATTPGPYNRLRLNLRGLNLTGKKLGLKKCNLFYSWSNILANTSIAVQWKVAGVYQQFIWILPAMSNYESISILNSSLQSFMINNGLYLINSAGSNVYYIELLSNPTTYSVNLNLFAVPTSLPSGWSGPSNFAGYPAVSATPKITFASNSEICNLLGFTAAVYDGVSTSISYSSAYTPQLSPVSSIFISCNIIKNDVSLNSSTVIEAFTTSDTAYGSMIEVKPSQVSYYEIESNTGLLEISFSDQNGNQLQIQDPSITVHLEII